MHLELVGHTRDVIDDRAHGVAGECSRKRAVQHIDAFDLLGSDEAPARREARAIAQQVRKQDSVGVNQRPGAVARSRGPTGENRVVEVADVSLAHEQAWEILERVFAVSRVDGLGDLLASHSFYGRRNVCG
jgi:hypothetical protein